ncbi:MAG: hypothetical protein WA821_19440 [Anaerolineales bacterium]
MAQRIEAIKAYCPRLNLDTATSEERFMELVTQRTTLSPGVVKNVQESEIETLIGTLQEGRPVHTGIAIYTPSIGLDGELEVNVKLDARVINALNTKDKFEGEIVNAENIGKSSDDLVALWNTAHPDNPVA